MRDYNMQERVSAADLKSVCHVRHYNLSSPCRGCQFEGKKPCTDYINKFHVKPNEWRKGQQNGTEQED